MKVVILCGGLGTRLREETEFRPKPMVEVGGRPILWHILKHYSRHGFHEFILCLGYKGDLIREYFLDYKAMNGDVRIGIGAAKVEYLDGLADEREWTVTLAETGAETATGGRLKKVRRHLDEGTFLWTYGDGVSNVDLGKLLTFHRAKGKLATVTGVRPVSRFGEIEAKDGIAKSFQEKPQLHAGRVNGGFFAMEASALADVGEDEIFERGPMQRLTERGQLAVYEHDGYWASMDTYRDTLQLNSEWASGRPGWLASA
ncbi:MAG: glucose-1-phosphate cytidylyltransferase [Chloroflexi bacterium]|nr:glucose-1-phosphate cytidylyltransferase [Chloroflexota bacterium]